MRKKRTLKEALAQKLREPKTLFLLGGGASFCAGLPGIFGLTDLVRTELRGVPRSTFDEIVGFLTDNGLANPNIEEVLSELHHRLTGAGLDPHSKKRLTATYEHICQSIHNILKVDRPTEYHEEFVLRIVSRRESEPAKKAPPVQVFTTNYDLLIELACEKSHMPVINGFEGVFHRKWSPQCFDYDIGKATTHVLAPRFECSPRHVRLYKLHGSLSWFEGNGEFCEERPSSGAERIPLIIYPSRLKYAESIRPPFDWLFRRFGAAVDDANLLVCIGYRFADDHLNQYIFAGLEKGLSLLVLSKEPIEALEARSMHPRVTVLNERRAIIGGDIQTEATNLWAFEQFAKWLPALKER